MVSYEKWRSTGLQRACRTSDSSEELPENDSGAGSEVGIESRRKKSEVEPEVKCPESKTNGQRGICLMPRRELMAVHVACSRAWTTSAQKPIGVISATMISLEEQGIAERVGEAWRHKAPAAPSWNLNEFERPLQQ